MTIVVNLFYIPMNLAFEISTDENIYMKYFFDDLPSYIFILEIILNCNTAFYDEGVIHTRRRAILANYFRNHLFWDFIAIIPFLISRFNLTYTNFSLLLRVTRIKEKFENFEEALNLRERFSTLMDLTRLIYFVLFVSHFCACCWYYVAVKEEALGIVSWLSVNQILNADIYTKYIRSIYFCTITITTVGYGDVVPTTSTEMIVTICMTLVTCGVFGYSINNIG